MAGSVWAAIIAFIVAAIIFFVIFFGAFVTVQVVGKSIQKGTPSQIARFTFLLLITAHSFLIYYCFLGGWRWFV